MSIAQNVQAVRARIAAAAAQAERDPAGITLVAVSKTFGAGAVAEAYQCGIRHFGENRVAEAVQKRAQLAGSLPEAHWHLIGHLQRNKVREAAESFEVVHSVDSLRLALALEARCAALERVLPVLLEVNVGAEASKSGYAPDGEQLFADAEQLVALPHLRLEGLMTIAPYASDPQAARPYFVRLRALRDALAARTGMPLPHLSMGMSGDFAVAIQEGATLVRIGTAIFGERAGSLR